MTSSAQRKPIAEPSEPVRILGRGLRARRGVQLSLRVVREAAGMTRVLSRDSSGRWIVRDAGSRMQLLSGRQRLRLVHALGGSGHACFSLSGMAGRERRVRLNELGCGVDRFSDEQGLRLVEQSE